MPKFDFSYEVTGKFVYLRKLCKPGYSEVFATCYICPSRMHTRVWMPLIQVHQNPSYFQHLHSGKILKINIFVSEFL